MRMLLALSVLSFSVSLLGQSAEAPEFALAAPLGGGCPILLGAERWSSGVMRDVDHRKPAQVVQGLFLHSQTTDSVTSINAVVHGIAIPSQLSPARPQSSETRTESFHLERAKRDRQGNWRLDITQVALVREVEIEEIAVANGEIWRETADNQCRVHPSPFLLVASTR